MSSGTARCSVAVVIPVLNEASPLEAQLRTLVAHDFKDVVVVDGGSSDATFETARASGGPRAHCLRAPAGRARQMNVGAAATRAEVLLFLHADTALPSEAVAHIRRAIADGRIWGRFDVRLDSPRVPFRWIERLMNMRSALTGIATGDQAIFVRGDAFAAIGGFADIALMEDVELCRRLKRFGWPARVTIPVVTSARRWEKGGIVRTVLLMWLLRLLYWLGVAPARLARFYRDVR